MNVEFRPSLLVGVGGTGTTVLTHIKSLLLDNIGEDVFETIRLVAFDTDGRLPEVRRNNGDIVKLDTYSEFVNIGNVPTGNILTNLNRYPEIADWLPSALPPQTVSEGAAMNRLLGRLAFFYHFQKIHERLEPEIMRLRHLKLMDRQVVSDSGDTIGEIGSSQSMNVFLVSSLCGGTGAGVFIDMAYVIRSICRRIVAQDDAIFMNGVLALPSVFRTVQQRTKIEANAKSCLDDLDTLMVNGFSEVYPRETRVSFPYTRPFDVCYLVDSINTAGNTLSGLDELAPMLANSIFLQISSQMGPAALSRWVNIFSTKATFEDRIKGYSGLGCAKLAFPSQHIMEACSRRFCQAFLDEKMLAVQLGTDDVIQLSTEFMNQNRLSPQDLSQSMLKGTGKRPAIRVSLSDQIDLSIDDILGTIQRNVKRTEERLQGDYAEQIRQNSEQVEDEIKESLAQRVDELVNDAKYGLGAAIQFVEQFEDELAELIKSLNDQRTSIEYKLRDGEQRNSTDYQSLSHAVSGRIPIWRNTQIKNTASVYLRGERERLSNRLALYQQDQVLSLLSSLRNHAAQQRRTYTGLRDRLKQIHHNLVVNAQAQLDTETAIDSLTWSVVTDADIEQFYNELTIDSNQWLEQAQSPNNCGPVASWRDWSQEELENRLLSFTHKPYESIKHINIEQFATDSGQDSAVNTWLRRIRTQSQPFWNWIKGQGVEPEDLIRVLGVPIQESSVFAGHVQQGEELISTNNAQSIAMLSTAHGLPSNALQDYPNLESAYSRQKRANSDFFRRELPIGLFDPKFRTPTMNLEERNLQLFGVGLVFGYIQQNESNVFYYCRPLMRPDEGWENVERLSSDLESAIEKLGQHKEYIDDLEAEDKRYRSLHGQNGVKQMALAFLKESPHSLRTDLADLRQKLEDAVMQWAGINPNE
ncbi:MAG: tubulin-like doman-containing protein [Chloroflexota bacterium]